MLRALLHPDSAASPVENLRRRKSRMPVGAVNPMFRSFDGYDTATSARHAYTDLDALSRRCHSIS